MKILLALMLVAVQGHAIERKSGGSGGVSASSITANYVYKGGDNMSGQLTTESTITVKGSAFSVGNSTLNVRNGRVGIGTTNPAQKLHVSSGTLIIDGIAANAIQVGLSSFSITSAGSIIINEQATAPAATTGEGTLYAIPSVSGDEFTVTILPMEAAGLNDTSPSLHTVTAFGNAVRSNTRAKFGTYSVALDGAGDYITLSNSSDYTFGSGDLTIEGWIYPTVLTRQGFFAGTTDFWLGILLNCDENSTLNACLFVSANGSSWNMITSDGAGPGLGSLNISSGSWNHVAVVRSGDNWKIFINGVQDISITAAGSVATKSEDKRVGEWGGGGIGFNGYIDEVRYSKGIARWTSNFTPASSAFSSTNRGLFYKDGAGLQNELTQWRPNGANIYYGGGLVGIGNTDPMQKLHITSGTIFIDGSVAGSTISISANGIIKPGVFTKAQIDGTNGVLGGQIICSDCTVPYDTCKGTSTSISGWRAETNSAINTAVPGSLVNKGCGSGN